MQQFQSLLCNFYLFVKYLLGGVKRRLTQTIVVTILKNAKANFYEKSIIFSWNACLEHSKRSEYLHWTTFYMHIRHTISNRQQNMQ